jgi:predicted GNAT superfamily acetyltransferase
METGILIRSVVEVDDVRQVEELQRVIWGADETEIVPVHMLLTVARNGGVLIGAFDGPRMVGFVFGVLGTDMKTPERVAMARLKHCSHQLGVHPDYRGRSLGLRLKMAQREAVMQQGIQLATWTYDPLMSHNAHLNIRRLGAVCGTYLRNLYGELRDSLNRGLPTDRFQVEWWLNSSRVATRLHEARGSLQLEQFQTGGARLINPATFDKRGLPRPVENPDALSGIFGLVEFPSDFLAIKNEDPELALAWRLQARAIFERAFIDGYLVTDFVQAADDSYRRSYYLLSYGDAKLGA